MEQDKKKIVHPEDMIKKYPDGSARVLMDNIMTTDQVIFPGMILLKAEGVSYDSITIISIQTRMDSYTSRSKTIRQVRSEPSARKLLVTITSGA